MIIKNKSLSLKDENRIKRQLDTVSNIHIKSTNMNTTAKLHAFFYSTILFLFSFCGFAQEIEPYVSFSGAIDIRNGLLGSSPTNNKPEANYILSFSMVGYNRCEVGIFYESFKRIEFERFGVNAGYIIPIAKRFTTTPSIQFSMIYRGTVEQEFYGKGCFLSYGAGLKFNYNVFGNFDIGLRSELINRTDLNYLYGGKNWMVSNYLEVTYKLKLK